MDLALICGLEKFSFFKTSITSLIYKLNEGGARRHPRCMPVEIGKMLKHSPNSLKNKENKSTENYWAIIPQNLSSL